MLFRAAGELRPRWRRPFGLLCGANFRVYYTAPPPPAATLPPEWRHAARHLNIDPAWIGRTLAECAGQRGAVVAVVAGGAGNRYLVSTAPPGAGGRRDAAKV